MLERAFERGDRVTTEIMRFSPGQEPYRCTLRGVVLGHDEVGSGTRYDVEWEDGTIRTHMADQLRSDRTKPKGDAT